MPWKNMKTFEQRFEFIKLVEQDLKSFSALCEDFGISRKTGYKWYNRYTLNEDVEDLKDESRAPHGSINRIMPHMAFEICELRKSYPFWGPKKLIAKLEKLYGKKNNLPSLSTTSRILKRNGLIQAQKRRRKTPPYTKPFAEVTAPNQVWCIDFKGHFRMGNKRRVYPLTITDAYSRYLICCEALVEPKTQPVLEIMEKIFREFGLPEAIRSDNGVPFATVGIGGLSELNVWWTKLGIRHERIEPGKPQQNGRHERMHRTLKQEACTNPSATRTTQQIKFNSFMKIYNFERPHEALGMKTPSEMYVRSDRLYRANSLGNNYINFGRKYICVSKCGSIEWQGHKIEIGKVLKNQVINVEDLKGGKWRFLFGPHVLGVFDERKPTHRLMYQKIKKVSPMSRDEVLPMF